MSGAFAHAARQAAAARGAHVACRKGRRFRGLEIRTPHTTINQSINQPTTAQQRTRVSLGLSVQGHRGRQVEEGGLQAGGEAVLQASQARWRQHRRRAMSALASSPREPSSRPAADRKRHTRGVHASAAAAARQKWASLLCTSPPSSRLPARTCRRCTVGTAPVGGELSSRGTRLGMRSEEGGGAGQRHRAMRAHVTRARLVRSAAFLAEGSCRRRRSHTGSPQGQPHFSCARLLPLDMPPLTRQVGRQAHGLRLDGRVVRVPHVVQQQRDAATVVAQHGVEAVVGGCGGRWSEGRGEATDVGTRCRDGGARHASRRVGAPGARPQFQQK